MRHAEHQAGHVLTALDAVARPRAETMALDEIFFRRQPCLVGVEPASMALLLCQRSADRTAATWKQALTPFTGLNYVCTDAGTGLQKRWPRWLPSAASRTGRLWSGGWTTSTLPRKPSASRAGCGSASRPAGTRPRKPTASAARFKARVTTAADPRPARVAWKRVADAMAWYDGRAAAWQRARQL